MWNMHRSLESRIAFLEARGRTIPPSLCLLEQRLEKEDRKALRPIPDQRTLVLPPLIEEDEPDETETDENDIQQDAFGNDLPRGVKRSDANILLSITKANAAKRPGPKKGPMSLVRSALKTIWEM
jgi:hypothetical protein